MDAKAQKDLYEIKCELQSIINELDSIARGVRNDFSGIGNDKCAQAICIVADRYRKSKKKLVNLDTSKVTSSFAASHGGGGGFR
jgi:hypothetical protein